MTDFARAYLHLALRGALWAIAVVLVPIWLSPLTLSGLLLRDPAMPLALVCLWGLIGLTLAQVSYTAKRTEEIRNGGA